MPNPEHRAAFRHANKATNDLKSLFDSALGSHAHPRGKIFRAYNVARKALDSNTSNQATVNQVTQELRATVTQAVTQALQEAQSIGVTQAQSDLLTYGYQAGGYTGIPLGDALAIIIAPLDAQIRALRSGRYTQASLLGDGQRFGLMVPTAVTAGAANWLTKATTETWATIVQTPIGIDNPEFVKQCIAGIDERTTRTCLRAHGQIQPLNQDFHLTETPRYADYLPNPPFHDRCRSVIALVLNTYADDELTQDMRRSAAIEREARGKASYTAPHPTNALTRVRR